MLPATFLKIALFALATVPAGFARPLGAGQGGANIDLQVRDEQIGTRAFDEIYDYVFDRELDEGAEELELRQLGAIGMCTLRVPFYPTYSICFILRSQVCAQDRR